MCVYHTMFDLFIMYLYKENSINMVFTCIGVSFTQ